jgi:hypothetical protein
VALDGEAVLKPNPAIVTSALCTHDRGAGQSAEEVVDGQ